MSGYRSPDSPALWIRDHSDILRMGRYVHGDAHSAVDAFALTQARTGRVYDHVTVATAAKEENWETWVRVPVEADVEYRFVKAAYLAWQATGDGEWMQRILPRLDAALQYSRTHEWRWDDAHQLVKRPYTIDTWDFDYTAGRTDWLNFQITDDTFWGLFHGDNSGVYEASRLLQSMYAAAGQPEPARQWQRFATGLRERANALLFNGRFYTHFHKLTPVAIDGVEEREQLSLSNPMAINRGLATHDMAVAVLREYRERRARSEAFAEWFSIDPPFPDGLFGDDKLVAGAYVNGGVMPLVGGELARAAFEHGREDYGVDTLVQYRDMIAEHGATYLWYFPDGTPSSEETSTSPDAMPTDGWGSSAMLYAFVEGLCGIEDQAHSFQAVRCAPRWVALDEATATVDLSYAASGASFGYDFHHRPADQAIDLVLRAEEAAVALHLLLPEGAQAVAVTQDGAPASCETVVVEDSPYAEAQIDVHGRTAVEVRYDV